MSRHRGEYWPEKRRRRMPWWGRCDQCSERTHPRDLFHSYARQRRGGNLYPVRVCRSCLYSNFVTSQP